MDVGAAVFCGGCCGCHAESRRAGIEASRLESVSVCRSPTPLCVRSLPAVAGVLCVEGRSLLSFVIDRWALDIDYCFFAVPSGVYYRYPKSGAGAGMNRRQNLATSSSRPIWYPDEAPQKSVLSPPNSAPNSGDVMSLLTLAAGLGLLCLGVAGCDIPDSELIGTYVGHYEGGRVEVFHIREDGTFDQTLLDGKTVYRNQGTWAIGREPWDVVFSDIMSPFQAPGEPLWVPRFIGWSYAGWDRRRGRIMFDTVISIRKVSSEVPPKDPTIPRMRDVYRKENTGEAVHGEP